MITELYEIQDFGKLAVLDLVAEGLYATLYNEDSTEKINEIKCELRLSDSTERMINQMYKYLRENNYEKSFGIGVTFPGLTRFSYMAFSDKEIELFENKMEKFKNIYDFDIFVADTISHFQCEILAKWADKNNKLFFTKCYEELDLSKFQNVYSVLPSSEGAKGESEANIAAEVSYLLQYNVVGLLFASSQKMTNGESLLEAILRVYNKKKEAEI